LPDNALFFWTRRSDRLRLNHQTSRLGPGSLREAVIAPLIVDLLSALKQLHELKIVHRDISLENVLRTKDQGGSMALKIIDFGMASSDRMFKKCVRGKASYQAPEMHADDEWDGFLSDAFSVGVLIYALLNADYPWLSTKPGQCKCFDFVERRGFRNYCKKRTLRGKSETIVKIVSPTMLDMLEGLLELDPKKRLTLGESLWKNDRKSVWDEPWMREHCKSV